MPRTRSSRRLTDQTEPSAQGCLTQTLASAGFPVPGVSQNTVLWSRKEKPVHRESCWGGREAEARLDSKPSQPPSPRVLTVGSCREAGHGSCQTFRECITPSMLFFPPFLPLSARDGPNYTLKEERLLFARCLVPVQVAFGSPESAWGALVPAAPGEQAEQGTSHRVQLKTAEVRLKDWTKGGALQKGEPS